VFGGFKDKSQLPNIATECMQGVMNNDHWSTLLSIWN
jgi:hypothetical protein